MQSGVFGVVVWPAARDSATFFSAPLSPDAAVCILDLERYHAPCDDQEKAGVTHMIKIAKNMQYRGVWQISFMSQMRATSSAATHDHIEYH